MNRCPKCGNYHITGPVYGKTHFGREFLRYTCNRCGYSENTQTLDTQKTLPFAAGER